MLIDFSHLCQKYQFTPKGIIHIGAHELEEMRSYNSMGVSNIVWIEGNPDLIEKNKSQVEGTNQKLLFGLVYSEDDLELEFKITNNFQSSSILEFGKHKDYHPHVEFIESKILRTTRVDSLLEKNDVSPEEFDFVNLDIQGVELQALKGFGRYLENIKYIYTEVNSGEVYKNNDSIEDLDNFLLGFGFERKETEMTPYEWGDAFYVRLNPQY
jgi:FkbM family methyltransferase